MNTALNIFNVAAWTIGAVIMLVGGVCLAVDIVTRLADRAFRYSRLYGIVMRVVYDRAKAPRRTETPK